MAHGYDDDKTEFVGNDSDSDVLSHIKIGSSQIGVKAWTQCDTCSA